MLENELRIRSRHVLCVALWVAVSLGVACGSTSLSPTQAGPGVITVIDRERCNGADDDAALARIPPRKADENLRLERRT